jgi:hypothetical protein
MTDRCQVTTQAGSSDYGSACCYYMRRHYSCMRRRISRGRAGRTRGRARPLAERLLLHLRARLSQLRGLVTCACDDDHSSQVA